METFLKSPLSLLMFYKGFGKGRKQSESADVSKQTNQVSIAEVNILKSVQSEGRIFKISTLQG